MDFGRRLKSKNVEYGRSRSREDRSFLRPGPSSTHAQHLSAPIPQTQWNETPDMFYPPSWSYSSDERNKPLPLSPSIDAQQLLSADLSPTQHKARNRRPDSLRGLHGSVSLQPDPSLLYPQMSPYHPRTVVRSAPHNMQYFSDVHGHVPRLNIHAARSSSSSSSVADSRRSLSRSPTYPGGSRARLRSASRTNENALQDEHEFHLFIEATAGLGPIPTFRQNSVSEDIWLVPRLEPRDHVARPASRHTVVPPMSPHGDLSHSGFRGWQSRDTTISSIGDTPTTVQALQGLAQIPHAWPVHPGRRHREAAPDPIIDISDSGLDIWEDSTQAPPSHHPADNWIEANDPGSDDELPTYASSQAQAHASQRAEATRRAQELQRRWTEGGRRYGPEL